jgi:hypothetical protein
MADKVRTQIQLERRQYERLKRLAYEQGKSLSAVVRDLLDRTLAPDTRADAVREARLGFVGAGRDTKHDVARNHDAYLFGEPT